MDGSPADGVTTLQGTDSRYEFSRGNTLPLVTWPHGLIGWTPQSDTGNWIFDPRQPRLQGLRATHQPSPWIGDHGNLLLLLGTGERPPVDPDDAAMSYAREETVARPHYLRLRLLGPEAVVEVAPTPRGACLRFRVASRSPVWLTLRPAAGRVESIDRAARTMAMCSTALAPGVAVPGGYGCFHLARVSAPVLDSGVLTVGGLPPAAPDAAAQAGWLRIRPDADGEFTLRIATSFIDADQVWLNLRRELEGFGFDDIAAAARTEWNRRLRAIEIEGASAAQRTTFYSCLHRALVHPRALAETDAAGRLRHRSFFGGGVHDGPGCTDVGLWDAHRSLMPLLTLVAPDALAEMIQGWVNAYREGGWLPGWASPGYIACMVGSHAGLVIADAWAKGIRDFDVESAYAAVKRDAEEEPAAVRAGRPGLSRYAALGWVPTEELAHAAARTCDYALADFATGRLAQMLGRAADARRFLDRALNYRHLYDRETGFLRGRRADGTWPRPFREWAWTRDYIEGGAWQHTWSAPHDAAGLIALTGGDAAFVAKLERMLAQPPHFEVGDYPGVIHEMTEMAAVPFGQYAHSNEPVHHVLHLFTAAGRPDLAQHWIRRVLDELYSPDAFCGDEDNGAMGSWYVLNALGLYTLTPGHPAWVLGAPLFPRATLRLPGGATFLIRAEPASPAARYVGEVRLNGRPWERLELPHAAIVAGGELTFVMTADPTVARRRGHLPRPFSLSQPAPPP